MDGPDGDGSFADGTGDALDGAVADVAGGENARHAALEWERGACGRPCIGRHVGAGEDEAVVIEADEVVPGVVEVEVAVPRLRSAAW